MLTSRHIESEKFVFHCGRLCSCVATYTKDQTTKLTKSFADHRQICLMFLNTRCTTQKSAMKTKNIVISYKFVDVVVIIVTLYRGIFAIYTILCESKNDINEEHYEQNDFCDNDPFLPFFFVNLICFVEDCACKQCEYDDQA